MKRLSYKQTKKSILVTVELTAREDVLLGNRSSNGRLEGIKMVAKLFGIPMKKIFKAEAKGKASGKAYTIIHGTARDYHNTLSIEDFLSCVVDILSVEGEVESLSDIQIGYWIGVFFGGLKPDYVWLMENKKELLEGRKFLDSNFILTNKTGDKKCTKM